jgi:tRNA-Thr(GGU) m(6)t(6)A37 methyltransferase TsaA
MEFSVSPVAVAHNTRTEPIDDMWDAVESMIELEPDFPTESLLGIDQFSHLEIIFCFHKADPEAVLTGADHPRQNPQWPNVGIFAQRRKARPNRIGATIVELIRVDGRRLHVCGLDAIDGTPILDIKPVFREFLPRSEVRQPRWSTELMRKYW